MINAIPITLICGSVMILLAAASFFSKNYSLNRIKSKTVGDGQHGTARWASQKEIAQKYPPKQKQAPTPDVPAEPKEPKQADEKSPVRTSSISRTTSPST